MALPVRPATGDDAPAMAAIDRQVSITPISESQYLRYCDGHPARTGLVCEHSAQLAGFVIFSQVLDEAEVINIAVAPDAQGKGFGKQLLQSALQRMKQQDATRCLLEVRESNKAARSLYVSMGFELDGKRTAYYTSTQGEREDALLMSLQM